MDPAYIGLRSGGIFTVFVGDPPAHLEKDYFALLDGESVPGFVTDAHGITADARQVKAADIAWGLARIDRFGGQTPRGISVCEHSYNGARVLQDASPVAARQFLIHDAAEALGVGDVHFKLKRLFAADLREKVEPLVVKAVAQTLGVPVPFDPAVNWLDAAMGHYEAARLHPASDSLLALYGLTRSGVIEAMKALDPTGFVFGRLTGVPLTEKKEVDLWLNLFWGIKT